MMASIAELMRRDARLTILRALAEASGYSVNHRILRAIVDRHAAITLDDDEIRGHLAWLEDAGAITTQTVGRFTLATLTDRGLALARGEQRVEGVSRPLPSDM